jgi:DNA-binding NarL/FixJ family response regulator
LLQPLEEEHNHATKPWCTGRGKKCNKKCNNEGDAVASITVMLVTLDDAFFERVRGWLHGRHEVQLLARVDAYRPLVAVRRERPQVLLVDGFSLGEGGISIVRRIAALGLPTKTLLVHLTWTESAVAHVLQCGGAGCLPRHTNPSEIIRAMRAVQRGELWASRKALADTLHLLRLPSARNVEDSHETLSKREREIVEWMRKGMTNKEIGRVLGISDMTVKTHAHNIFHKLEVSGRRLLGALPALQQ